MPQHDSLQHLSTAEELPDSDDTPVDNELQILIPNLLRAILALLWAERHISPLLALEVVSQTYGKEYEDKKAKYANNGVLYYVIYNPDYWKLHNHEPLEVSPY